MVNDVTSVTFELPASYDEARSQALLSDLTAALRDSSVRPIGFASREPLAESRSQIPVRVPLAAQAEHTMYLEVSPGYFDVLRIPIVAGRTFRSAEPTGTLLINESMARRHWPNENPVGKMLQILRQGQPEPYEIVGVVRNAYTAGLSDFEPIIYQPVKSTRPSRNCL